MMSSPSTAPELALYDLRYLYGYDLEDPQQAKLAYSHMHLVATLQGVVNRDAPNLYVTFVDHNQFGPLNIDAYWLEKLRAPGEWLAGHSIEPVADLDALIHRFRRHVRGAVIWDPNVPATANVASTVAGVEDLVAVMYDPNPDSLYTRYAAPQGAHPLLPAQRWLVNSDGTPLFTGRGTIPGTDLPTTGSAKCDAYYWAKVQYLDTGCCTPTELGYYVDSWWLRRAIMAGTTVQHADLLNHDYLVSHRGFLFDLLPWDDERPVDDETQPVGTDRQALEAILRSAYEQSQGQMVAIHGFVPWAYKYTNHGAAGGTHPPVPTEWECVRIASAYNAYLDADAFATDGMANASVFQHYPLPERYVQNPKPTIADLQERGFVTAEGRVAPRHYVMFYVGDYDSAAWLYHTIPHLWDDSERGAVPLNWAFNPNLAHRMAPALAYTRATATPNDVFIAGDSGAGYVNPGMLQEPRAVSGLPSGLETWAEHCARYYHQWDLSITGFVIDGFARGLNCDGLATYRRFSTDGLAAQKIAPFGLVDNMPTLMTGIDLPDDVDKAASLLADLLRNRAESVRSGPWFHWARTVLRTPSWHKTVVEQVQKMIPEVPLEFVDAHALFSLLRQHLKDQLVVTPLQVSASPGRRMPLIVQVHSYAGQPADVTLSFTSPSGWDIHPSEVHAQVNAGATSTVSCEIIVPVDATNELPVIGVAARYDGVVRHYSFEASLIPSSYRDANRVEIALGSIIRPRGLEILNVIDGMMIPCIVGNRDCCRVSAPGEQLVHLSFRADEGFMGHVGDRPVSVLVEYFDGLRQHVTIEYGSLNESSADEQVGECWTGGSGRWRQLVLPLPPTGSACRVQEQTIVRLIVSDDLCLKAVALVHDRTEQG